MIVKGVGCPSDWHNALAVVDNVCCVAGAAGVDLLAIMTLVVAMTTMMLKLRRWQRISWDDPRSHPSHKR